MLACGNHYKKALRSVILVCQASVDLNLSFTKIFLLFQQQGLNITASMSFFAYTEIAHPYGSSIQNYIMFIQFVVTPC